MGIDWSAVGLALVIEAALLVLAAFGGPHGTLGGAPWVAQLPGMLLVLYPPGGARFGVRVAAGALAQLVLWYVLLAAIRRHLRRWRAEPPSAR
jgi:hypothetical protein